MNALFFVKKTIHLSSHSCPIETNDSLVKLGKTRTFEDPVEILGPKSIVPSYVALMEVPFGRWAIGPFWSILISFKKCMCSF